MEVDQFLQSQGLQNLKPAAKPVDQKDPVKNLISNALGNPSGKFHPTRIKNAKKKHAALMKSVGDKKITKS
jgi:hypothetical protein